MRALTLLLLVAAAAAAVASPIAGGRRALLASKACATFDADVIVTMKLANGTAIVQVAGGKATLNEGDSTELLGNASALCVPAKFKSYSVTATHTAGGAQLTTTLALSGAGLSSMPAAAGECADVLKPVVTSFKLDASKTNKAKTVKPLSATARVCRPCLADLTRNLQTGACYLA